MTLTGRAVTFASGFISYVSQTRILIERYFVCGGRGCAGENSHEVSLELLWLDEAFALPFPQSLVKMLLPMDVSTPSGARWQRSITSMYLGEIVEAGVVQVDAACLGPGAVQQYDVIRACAEIPHHVIHVLRIRRRKEQHRVARLTRCLQLRMSVTKTEGKTWVFLALFTLHFTIFTHTISKQRTLLNFEATRDQARCALHYLLVGAGGNLHEGISLRHCRERPLPKGLW